MSRLTEEFLKYLRYERAYSAYTRRSYAKDLEQFETYVREHQEGAFEPAQVDADIVRNWLASLLNDGKKTSSVNRKLSTLKSFFKFLVKQEVIAANPLRLVRGPKTKKPLPQFVRDSEMQQLLDGDTFGDDFEGLRNRLIMELLYDTGIRRAEMLGIKDRDIDFGASLLKVTGKRNKQRLIPFADGLKNQMLAYIQTRNREAGSEGGWLFVRNNGQRLSEGMLHGIVKRSLATVAALSKRSPHVLRHSFATAMLNNGAELNAVKELMGHSSIASTAIYTHVAFEELKKVYRAHPRGKK